MKKILITAPLRQDVDIFEAYQEGLDRLEVPEGFTVDRYFLVNDCKEVISHIHDAEFDITETGENYEKTHNDHLWSLELMLKMGEMRNRTIRKAMEAGMITGFPLTRISCWIRGRCTTCWRRTRTS